MRIILIRHGETYANELFHTDDRLLIGALDTQIAQLNDKGRQQAKSASKQLENIHIDEIYSSDLGRTIETTSLIFPNRTFKTTPLLRERSLGSDEGKKAIELFSNPSVWERHVNTEIDTIEECMSKKVSDGENYIMVFNRLNEFLSQFDFNEDKTIVCVAHFHTIRCMIYTLLNKKPDRELFNLMIPNASPILFEYQNGKFTYMK